MRLIIFISTIVFLSSCATSKLDRLAKRDYKKNIESTKVLLYAHYEGPASIDHSFTLRENHKFAYMVNIFGKYTYCTGEWKQNDSATIKLDYYLNHGLDEFQPFILAHKIIDTSKNNNGTDYIEFIRKDTSMTSNWKFDITYVDSTRYELKEVNL